MRIESGTGSSDEVAGNVLEISLGMILSPHIKEDRLNVRAVLERFNGRLNPAISSFASNGGGKLPLVLLGKALEENDRKIISLWLRGAGVILNPLGYQG